MQMLFQQTCKILLLPIRTITIFSVFTEFDSQPLAPFTGRILITCSQFQPITIKSFSAKDKKKTMGKSLFPQPPLACQVLSPPRTLTFLPVALPLQNDP